MPSLRLNPRAKSSRVCGRCHHHHMGDAVIDQGHGVSVATQSVPSLISPAFQMTRVTLSEPACCHWLVPLLLLNKPCCCLSKDFCRACQLEGSVTLLSCTAVTLYSGQLVAQSLLSVVITLAPDTGWWKVVYTTPGFTRSVTLARSTVSPTRLLMPTQSPWLIPRSSASWGGFLAVFAVPFAVVGASGLGAYIVLGQYAAGGEQQRKLAVGALGRWAHIRSWQRSLCRAQIHRYA